MENVLIFASEKEVRFTKLLKFIVPTYLTSLFNTVYTIIDGIFVSTYVGTNALASINIVYPIVNVLTGIALVFATGGSAVTALHIGGNRKKEADRSFSVSSFAAILLGCLVSLMILTNLSAILTILGANPVTIAGCKTYARWWLLAAPVVIGKELFTYFIRVDGAPTYSFITALSGGILNIVLDYILVGQMQMGIYGAALATILGLVLSFSMGIYYFIHKQKYLSFTLHNLSLREAMHCMINGASEFVNQLAIAVTTIVFNRTALSFTGEDGIAAVSIIMYLQFFVYRCLLWFFYGHGTTSELCVWRPKNKNLPKTGKLCSSLFCSSSNRHLCTDLLSYSSCCILFRRYIQPCISYCSVRNESLRTWFSIFRN